LPLQGSNADLEDVQKRRRKNEKDALEWMNETFNGATCPLVGRPSRLLPKTGAYPVLTLLFKLPKRNQQLLDFAGDPGRT
jgi:hypothetical protein